MIGLRLSTLRTRFLSLLCCLVLSACAGRPQTYDTPYLAANLFEINGDADTGAINYSAWAFASDSRLAGDPAAAMRAEIAVEYLAGALRDSGRWFAMAQSTKTKMVQARQDIRAIVGIRPDAPSQAVVDALLVASNQILLNNRPGALLALSAPVFTATPEQTLAIYSNLPFIPAANAATSAALAQTLSAGGGRN